MRARLIPHRLPSDERAQIDLSELADADARFQGECERLEELLAAHIAVYRAGAKARPTGLCTVFKYATLTPDQAAALGISERCHPSVIFVAYARPLARW
jgi:hypothetical protein